MARPGDAIVGVVSVLFVRSVAAFAELLVLAKGEGADGHVGRFLVFEVVIIILPKVFVGFWSWARRLGG